MNGGETHVGVPVLNRENAPPHKCNFSTPHESHCIDEAQLSCETLVLHFTQEEEATVLLGEEGSRESSQCPHHFLEKWENRASPTFLWKECRRVLPIPPL